MEFTCKISYKDFQEAQRLKQRVIRRGLFAVLLVAISLYVLWIFLTVDPKDFVSHLSRLLPPVIFPGLYFLSLRSLKRHDNPYVELEYTYHITKERIAYESSEGGVGQFPWNLLSYWQESKGIFIFVFPSGVFLICPKSCLSKDQQTEFTEIVGSVLQKK